MDKKTILNKILKEQQKVIDNLKASVERYKTASDLDEDSSLDPEDYARQTEAKDMQLRYEKLLKAAKTNLEFIKNSEAETSKKIESGALVETEKNYLFFGVSTPTFIFEGKDVICISEEAPVFKNIKGRKINETIEIGKNSFEILKIS